MKIVKLRYSKKEKDFWVVEYDRYHRMFKKAGKERKPGYKTIGVMPEKMVEPFIRSCEDLVVTENGQNDQILAMIRGRYMDSMAEVMTFLPEESLSEYTELVEERY